MMAPSASFDPARALHIAEGVARTAGAMLRRDFRLPRQVRDKGVNDLVTESDVNSERMIVSMLSATYPDHCFIGEELGSQGNPDADYTWWIDPLDATYNFVHYVPRFSISLACVDRDSAPLVGLVYDPNFEECFTALPGGGAFCNGAPIQVSSVERLRDSLAASGFPGDLRTTDNNTAQWTAFVSRCQNMARMGSAALDMCYVAAGRFDLYWEYTKPPLLDRIAGALIVREAGGMVTDCEGGAFDFQTVGSVFASNGAVHDEALGVLQSAQ